MMRFSIVCGAEALPALRLRRRHALALAGLLALSGCRPPPPLRIGLLGGAGARGASSSDDGRDGALVAIERINQAGGVRARSLELVVRDPGQTQDSGRAALQALADVRAEAAVGPFTTASVLAVQQQADAAGLLMISPSANAPVLVGRDDQLIRLNGSLTLGASVYAQALVARRQRRLAVALDLNNRSYAEAWLAAVRQALAALGGEVLTEVGYASEPGVAFGELVRQMLLHRPDGLMFVTSGVDAARLAQQAAQQAPGLPLAVAEWATSAALLELGGRAVEGMLAVQPNDPADPSPAYQSFRTDYLRQFAREPSFRAVGAFDAVTILATALARVEPGESLKNTVLRLSPHQGLQQVYAFDRFGDVERAPNMVVVHEGRFVPLR